MHCKVFTFKNTHFVLDRHATQIFLKDIDVLLSMSKLWEKRRPPVPLHYDDLPSDVCQDACFACPYEFVPAGIRP